MAQCDVQGTALLLLHGSSPATLPTIHAYSHPVLPPRVPVLGSFGATRRASWPSARLAFRGAATRMGRHAASRRRWPSWRPSRWADGVGGCRWLAGQGIVKPKWRSVLVSALEEVKDGWRWWPEHAACFLAAPLHHMQRKGGRACCGVTTGQLFCAMVGSQRRSEYTVFGNAINLRWGAVRACGVRTWHASRCVMLTALLMNGQGGVWGVQCTCTLHQHPRLHIALRPYLFLGSARLMVRARDRGAEVYCDATTQQLAKHKVRLTWLGHAHLSHI